MTSQRTISEIPERARVVEVHAPDRGTGVNHRHGCPRRRVVPRSSVVGQVLPQAVFEELGQGRPSHGSGRTADATTLEDGDVVPGRRQGQLRGAVSDRKNDRNDAELLARVARLDPKLLSPIRHRSESCQLERASLLSSRTRMVCVAHVSNALGTIVPVKAAATRAVARPTCSGGATCGPGSCGCSCSTAGSLRRSSSD